MPIEALPTSFSDSMFTMLTVTKQEPSSVEMDPVLHPTCQSLVEWLCLSQLSSMMTYPSQILWRFFNLDGDGGSACENCSISWIPLRTTL